MTASDPDNPCVKRGRPEQQPKLPLVSLFCGPGGLDLGFQNAGFDTILALDRSAVAVKTFNLNVTPVAREMDLAAATDEEVLALVRASGTSPVGVIGGPPCQGFSNGNTRQRRNDPRRRLTLRFADLVGALDAAFSIDFFVMENVAALAKPKHKPLLDRTRRRFHQLGFATHVAVANAVDFGVAQNRPRLFVVGIKRDLAGFARFTFPERTVETDATIREVIGHLPDPAFFDRTLTADTIAYHPNHWTMVPKSAKFRRTLRSSVSGRSFRRLQWGDVSPTIAYGHRELHVHPDGTRRVSILEGMLMQGFPEWYEMTGNLSEQVIQVSEAVPPPLAEALATSVRKRLYDRRAAAQAILATFYKTSRRAFPWRQTADPFRLLIAEKLLQQTAATGVVVNAYEEILRRWPDPKSLAKAKLTDVRRVVQPLGLTYRADELVAMAKAVVREHGGTAPLDRGELLALPGVGDYAANAVRSFTRAAEVAVVDTNVSRLLHRLFNLRSAAPSNPARDRRLHRLAEWLIAGGSSRELNYAILDITAAHCVARGPLCGACSLSLVCPVAQAA